MGIADRLCSKEGLVPTIFHLLPKNPDAVTVREFYPIPRVNELIECLTDTLKCLQHREHILATEKSRATRNIEDVHIRPFL